MHDAAWQERERSGNHQGAEEEAKHGPAMMGNVVTAGVRHGNRQHHQREQREQMDRAEGPPQPDFVISSELAAIENINNTQTQPMVRCGIVPFGSANCPSPRAPIAENACSWTTAGA